MINFDKLVQLIRINNDTELDIAIGVLDNLLDQDCKDNLNPEEEDFMQALGDIVHEYEQRTDILNRPLN